MKNREKIAAVALSAVFMTAIACTAENAKQETQEPPETSMTAPPIVEAYDTDFLSYSAPDITAADLIDDEAETEPFVYRFTEQEVDMVARTVWGEAGACSREEQRLVAWCICNRVDAGLWGDTVAENVEYPNAFYGYDADAEIHEESREVARDVLIEWSRGDSSDVLEPYCTSDDYLYFFGDGSHNWFRSEW